MPWPSAPQIWYSSSWRPVRTCERYQRWCEVITFWYVHREEAYHGLIVRTSSLPVVTWSDNRLKWLPARSWSVLIYSSAVATIDMLISIFPTLSLVIATGVQSTNRHRIYFPFSWVLRLLKTMQHGNYIEEISILIDHSRRFDWFTPSESNTFPWGDFSLLLTETSLVCARFKYCCRSTILPVKRRPFSGKLWNQTIRGPKALLWRAFSKWRKRLVSTSCCRSKVLCWLIIFYWNLANRSFITFHEFEKCVPC